MKKEEVQAICEGDERMAWIAMVLFADLAETIEVIEYQEIGSSVVNSSSWKMVKAKFTEFEKSCVARLKEIAAGKAKNPVADRLVALERRVAKLEKK